MKLAARARGYTVRVLCSATLDRHESNESAGLPSRMKEPCVEAATDPCLLELRSHARPARTAHPAGRHRPHLPEPAGRGDVLSHAPPSRVRRRGDVALLVRRVALQTG